ncbi:hypothetical protein IGL98_000386 [Enterococcus sp. DIV0840]|uniref:hypothetical protein n=1 Tax=unclassified Enterococcus TaxID=2608891 RepID=UPI001A8F4DCE|nr:hypothetical protein [Enterococcus sp. DIV0849a]MBO0435653.1 hypothetical protein [Enterococcus sp. DIV0849a]
MKKMLLLVLTGFLYVVLAVPLKEVQASEINTLPNGYYTVQPKLNSNLQVDYKFKLANLTPGYGKFEFYYIPNKDAYVINDQFGFQSVKWAGSIGVGNLDWENQNINDSSMLWTVEQVSDNQYIIHNKKDGNLVWDVHNYNPNLGTPIKLENQHPANSPSRQAQIFVLNQ